MSVIDNLSLDINLAAPSDARAADRSANFINTEEKDVLGKRMEESVSLPARKPFVLLAGLSEMESYLYERWARPMD